MAFNDYITLDGKRYRTLAKAWRPVILKPATARLTLQGNMESTFGVGALTRWEGMIAAPASVNDSAWGTIDDLRSTLRKTTTLSFTDHYARTYTVTAIGPFTEASLVNVWTAPGNKIYVNAAFVSADNPA